MHTLPRAKIIKDKKLIQKIYQKGKSYTGFYLVLYIFKVKRAEARKVAFAAGKKLGHAALRNRLKRLLRESYRLEQEHIKGNLKIFLVARRPMLHVKRYNVQKELVKLLKRAAVYDAE